jgi:hypothetical protein
MKSLVFIPAWNEEESIDEVVGDVREHMPDADLLVVDDGSTDATAARRFRPATCTRFARDTTAAPISTPTGSTRPPR